MLNWSKQFSILLFLDSNNYSDRYSKYECLLATGAVDILTDQGGDLLNELAQQHTAVKGWLFGHIAYDYKNLLEPKLRTRHPQKHGFPLAQFFRPQTVCTINAAKTQLSIECLEQDPQVVFQEIMHSDEAPAEDIPKLSFSQTIEQQAYLETIQRLRKHIEDGDCYEINFCNEGHSIADIDPQAVFHKLNTLSPAPFAAFYRNEHHYLMCASPERYLLKNGRSILSQPIKGTARRNHADPQLDDANKHNLRQSRKEQAENVMIVDLVRNDLARSCETGSVHVDELFGIYSFPQVHQMISTVSGTLRQDTHFADAIRYSFPMGSMTGAPKVKVMQLIDEYEQAARELFSGTVGYISPYGDFDFNVIIRSLFYNQQSRLLSYQTGGAITWDSDPQQEWEEMRLKAWALEKIFS